MPIPSDDVHDVCPYVAPIDPLAVYCIASQHAVSCMFATMEWCMHPPGWEIVVCYNHLPVLANQVKTSIRGEDVTVEKFPQQSRLFCSKRC
jgi:hypothetical protein